MMLALVLTGGVAAVDQGSAVHLVGQAPVAVKVVEPGVYLVDFGKVAFGNVVLEASGGSASAVKVHFGEALKDGRIDRKPPGTVRYAAAEVALHGGGPQVVAPAADARNTQVDSKDHPPAILTPKEWGVVLPFRWVEVEGWPGKLSARSIKRRAAFATSWDDKAASFECSDPMLNRVWELCRYSIKATTFAGVFVDGDRERIPYEADAYLNQLSYYATSTDNEIPRATFDHLMKHGTWPTEWAYHMVFMAYADWMRTGDKAWLSTRYDALRKKLLFERVAPDGLVHSGRAEIERTDIVDWPAGERDGYQFGPANTVVNAFYLRSLQLMRAMGEALGRGADAAYYATWESQCAARFYTEFFDEKEGLYRDGSASDHKSLHGNLFPLAFGLAPKKDHLSVASWLAARGMRCSVYAAQYLLEGLFENEQEKAAIDLMTAPGDRSWRHMVTSGATITWEAWDLKYKPNQDWNHAWGAAPANLLPRFVLGVQARTPGWKTAVVKPHPGGLRFAKGKVPTPLGPVMVDWRRGTTFTMRLDLPWRMSAHVELPTHEGATGVYVNGKPATAKLQDGLWVLESEVSGKVKIELR